LRLLQPFHAGLPLDARTLLSTPFATQLNVKEIDVGSYHHFGVENQLQKLYKSGMLIVDVAKDNCMIELQVNLDGLPIFKSTNFQLWPILGMVIGNATRIPFTIGIFGANCKPGNISQFLEDFVLECHRLETN
jgi:hypothetical protein